MDNCIQDFESTKSLTALNAYIEEKHYASERPTVAVLPFDKKDPNKAEIFQVEFTLPGFRPRLIKEVVIPEAAKIMGIEESEIIYKEPKDEEEHGAVGVKVSHLVLRDWTYIIGVPQMVEIYGRDLGSQILRSIRDYNIISGCPE